MQWLLNRNKVARTFSGTPEPGILNVCFYSDLRWIPFLSLRRAIFDVMRQEVVVTMDFSVLMLQMITQQLTFSHEGSIVVTSMQLFFEYLVRERWTCRYVKYLIWYHYVSFLHNSWRLTVSFIVPSQRKFGRIFSVLYDNNVSCYLYPIFHTYKQHSFSSKRTGASLYNRFFGRASVDISSISERLIDMTQFSDKSTW